MADSQKIIQKSKLTQVEWVIEKIKSDISNHQLNIEDKFPSARKLATLFQVTHDAVWKALQTLLAEKYLTQEGRNYLVHPRFSVTHKSKLKIVLTGQGVDSLRSNFISGIYEELVRRSHEVNMEFGLLLKNNEEHAKAEDFKAYDIALLTTGWSQGVWEKLRDKGVKHIGLAPPYCYGMPVSVRLDHIEGGFLAAQALVAKNATRVVILGESLRYPKGWHELFELRAMGVKKAWIMAGRSLDEIQELVLPLDFFKQIDIIRELLKNHQEGTNYICLSNEISNFFYKSLQSSDKFGQVPFIGFDYSSELRDAGICCIDYAKESTAQALIRLIRILEKEDLAYKESVYIAPVLMGSI